MARFCFLPMPLGTGTARAFTTPPADAHNVTQGRKICGSPRFALFRIAAPQEAGASFAMKATLGDAGVSEATVRK